MAKNLLSISGRFGFRNVQLLENEELGRGSYGVVYKAKCDQLLCAAKVLHPILFQTSDPTARIEQRFKQEIDLLRELRHPNIVQFLGVCHHPKTDLPILFMELMDINLTTFLEQSTDRLPLYLQVNIAHDVAQALSHLHHHNIIHRDLSSNNVLLIGSCRAKVTDFGMAKLQSARSQLESKLTSNPGTNVYMSPEAVTKHPRYSTKLDIFSCGVLFVQLVTREFPAPSSPTIEGTTPGVLYVVPEITRRKNHIDSIELTHPLREVALECLKNAEESRPSTEKLCLNLIALKESPVYKEILHHVASLPELVTPHTFERRQSIYEEKIDDLTQQVHQLKRTSSVLSEENEALIHELQKSKATLTSSMEEKDVELQEKIQTLQKQPSGPLNLYWKEKTSMPFPTFGESVAVTDGVAYFCDAVRNNRVLMYTLRTRQWTELPICPKSFFSIAIVNGMLTAIGGKTAHGDQKSLLCLPEHRHLDQVQIAQLKWNEKLPRMNHFHNNPAIATTKSSLIVAGGFSSEKHLVAVEVLDTTTTSWREVASLPHPLQQAVANICGNRIYIGGGIIGGKKRGTKSVIMCELDILFQTASAKSSAGFRRSHSIGSRAWTTIASLPVRMFSLVTLRGQLLAIGGCDNGFPDDTTSDVYQYNVLRNSWNVISRMKVNRFRCFAAVFADETLMVVGGQRGHDSLNDVETASFV